MFVCLSVRSHISKRHMSILHEFLYMLTAWPWLAVRYVLPADDVMFSHNGHMHLGLVNRKKSATESNKKISYENQTRSTNRYATT